MAGQAWDRFETAGGLVGHTAGDGERTVLVLHGGPGLSDYVGALAEEVLAADPGLRVVRYQQRGLAPSTLDGARTVATFVADALDVLDHLGVQRAVVAGHSWGAHLALHIAVAHPERVDALLLFDGLGAIGDGGAGTMAATLHGRIGPEAVAAIAAIEADEARAPAERARAGLALLWPGYFSDPQAAPPMPDDLELAAAVNEEVFTDAARLLGDRVLEQALPFVDAPALHVIGRQSPIDPSNNERTAELMPRGETELVDCGHFCWLELPGSATAATRRLLQML